MPSARICGMAGQHRQPPGQLQQAKESGPQRAEHPESPSHSTAHPPTPCPPTSQFSQDGSVSALLQRPDNNNVPTSSADARIFPPQ